MLSKSHTMKSHLSLEDWLLLKKLSKPRRWTLQAGSGGFGILWQDVTDAAMESPTHAEFSKVDFFRMRIPPATFDKADEIFAKHPKGQHFYADCDEDDDRCFFVDMAVAFFEEIGDWDDDVSGPEYPKLVAAHQLVRSTGMELHDAVLQTGWFTE